MNDSGANEFPIEVSLYENVVGFPASPKWPGTRGGLLVARQEKRARRSSALTWASDREPCFWLCLAPRAVFSLQRRHIGESICQGPWIADRNSVLVG